MRAIRLEQPGVLKKIDCDDATAPSPGEALVRVHSIGVCGTDIHAFNGKQPFFTYPRILGHELGVEVLETGRDVTTLKAGDRCALEPYLNCGRCIACRQGKSNCCAHLKVLGVHTDGGMREKLVVPADKLHPSAVLQYDQLALVETLGIGAHAVDRTQVTTGEFALIVGAGPIGLSVMQFAMAAGAKVIVLDIHESRLEFCRGLGVRFTINGSRDNVIEQLTAITEGDLPNVVFDATGNAKSMMQSFDYPCYGGRLAFVGLFQGEVTFNDPNFHRRELTLLASRNARPPDFTRIIQLIEDGRIDLQSWITHRCAFDETLANFPKWTDPKSGVIKAMIALA